MAFVIRKAGGASAQERVEAQGIDWSDVMTALKSEDSVSFYDEDSSKKVSVPAEARLIEGRNGYSALNFEIGSDSYSMKTMSSQFPEVGTKVTFVKTVSVWDGGDAAAVTYEAWVGPRTSQYKKAGTTFKVSDMTRKALDQAKLASQQTTADLQSSKSRN